MVLQILPFSLTTRSSASLSFLGKLKSPLLTADSSQHLAVNFNGEPLKSDWWTYVHQRAPLIKRMPMFCFRRSWDLTYHYVGFEQMHHLHQLAQKPPPVSALEIRAEKEALICVGTRGFITLEPPLGKPSTSIAKAQPRRPHFPISTRCLSPPPRFCTLCGCLLD